jgi:RNA polymerase sigma-70 factor, ECF subfamily
MKPTAFHENVAKLGNSLKPFAYSLTRDKNDADDLIQETMFKALSRAEKFNEGTNLKAWMYTIMKNIFINDYRRTRNRKTVSFATYDLQEIAIRATATNDGEHNIALENLNFELKQLNFEIKIPFLMHHHGYKYEEIAKKLDVPLGTVKSRIYVARRVLKQKLTRF